MFRLIETIRLSDGQFNNIPYHEERMHRAMKQIFGVDKAVNLEKELSSQVKPSTGLFKCRLTYSNKTSHVEFIPYAVRKVGSLKIVHDDDLSYDHKFEDRKEIDQAYKKRRTCDDVLIIKKGFVTDTSNANIAFRSGETWFTPQSFLLPGTMRQSLLDKKVVLIENIHLEDVSKFESFKLMNAMVLFDSPEVPIENIVS